MSDQRTSLFCFNGTFLQEERAILVGASPKSGARFFIHILLFSYFSLIGQTHHNMAKYSSVVKSR